MENHTEELCEGSQESVFAFHDEVRKAIQSIGGKWKLEILWLLSQRTHRFNELRRAIPGVTQHMLTAQLRELEADGLVHRTVHPEIPPRVEYTIAEEAKRMRPVFEAIFVWVSGRRNSNKAARVA
ncbi:winged helix-turn-helix transcriptional regulator [Luteimonas aquatica]|uniref:winged helix-turn-helix transcriptional regulator n=1 Tax=Luteimonas aquatica TaxID=450364 RepID=UPI001F57455B|nr:helix-turn-helix domain-containing protein [Luteimonas aquatica]